MEINTHILTNFNDDLSALQSKLDFMVKTVESSLDQCMEALLKEQKELCNTIIAEDDDIDAMQHVIDSHAASILMRYNPVASDLRFVICSISIAKNLERVADHIAEIAKNSRKVLKKAVMSTDVNYVNDLFSIARQQFENAKIAIIKADPEIAEKCLNEHNKMRKLNKKISKIYVGMMNEQSNDISAYLALVMIARSFERISQLSCNIAEEIIYIETAEGARATEPTE